MIFHEWMTSLEWTKWQEWIIFSEITRIGNATWLILPNQMSDELMNEISRMNNITKMNGMSLDWI